MTRYDPRIRKGEFEVSKTNAVTKPEFIKQLVTEYGYTKSAASMFVDDFWSLIQENIENGRSVFFYGYGCFDLLERKERRTRNPQNSKEIIVIPAHYVPRFYPGDSLRRAVKIWEDNERRGLN